MNVWIIEDNPATRMLMQTLVNSGVTEKHTITSCASVEEAYQKLETAPFPDVFIVDLNLPGISGLEFCAQIRKRLAGQSEYLPYMMVVTANEGSEVLAEVLDAGANDYLAKPVHVKVLQTRLRVAQRLIDQARFQMEADYIKALAAFTLNHAGVPAAIVEAQGNGGPLTVAFANAAMLNLLNSSTDGAMGHSLAALQEWKAEMTSALQQSLSKGEAFHSRLLSGSAHFSSLDLRLSVYPVQGEASLVLYLVIEDKMLAV
jgi:CheY-like chemotaxis protein